MPIYEYRCENGHNFDVMQKMTDDPQQQIVLAYRLAFGRPPSAPERGALLGYAQRHGLANACRVLLNCNEFHFID